MAGLAELLGLVGPMPTRGDQDYSRLGADIPPQVQGQALLEALAKSLPTLANPEERAQATERTARAQAMGPKDVDIGMLLQMLQQAPNTENPEAIGNRLRASRRGIDYDVEQAELRPYTGGS